MKAAQHLLWLITLGFALLSSARAANATSQLVRVAAAQAARRVIDYRLTNFPAVFAAVEKNLSALEAVVAKAGGQKCDVLALPEDTPGLLNWIGMNEALARDVLPTVVKRMIEQLGQAAARHRMYLVVCSDHLESDGAIYNTSFFLGRDGMERDRLIDPKTGGP